MESIANGVVHQEDREVQLAAATLRRIARLHARSEGANQVAQAAIEAARAAQAAVQQALAEACEEEGISIPPDTQPVNIDWRTGRMRIGT